jgi:hypothetical protein
MPLPPAQTPGERPPPLAEVVGGPLGMAETALPTVAFIVVYTITSETNPSAAAAVGLALVLAAARVVRRDSPRNALSGLVGVAFAAFIATRSGRAENFFLPGLLANAAYAAAFLGSIALRRPLVGILVEHLGHGHPGWRENPVLVRGYNQASLLWAGLFIVRIVVQLPLYLAGAVVALGVARTAMGLPLFALGIWLTWLMIRRHRDPPEAER